MTGFGDSRHDELKPQARTAEAVISVKNYQVILCIVAYGALVTGAQVIIGLMVSGSLELALVPVFVLTGLALGMVLGERDANAQWDRNRHG
jgi:hypothetical protein